MYIYPSNLRAKPMLWLWELRDLFILVAAAILAVLSVSQLGFTPPIIFVAVYAFLTIRFEDYCIMDFLVNACRFFLLGQQIFQWRWESCSLKDSGRSSRKTKNQHDG